MGQISECVENIRRKGLDKTIDSRMNEFRQMKNKNNDGIFKELCFCILTANFSAEGGIRIQKQIGDGFLTLDEAKLAERLGKLGHRYPNTRAKYIVEARKHKNSLWNKLKSMNEHEARDWLSNNVKGLGYKEASHFMRNIGYENLAIIDFHIIDLLERHGLIERPKTLTKRKYMEIENVLAGIASNLGMSLAELDLYLWCDETGKILK